MTNNESKIAYIRTALLEMPPKFDPPTEGYLRHQGLDTNTIRPMGLNECMFSPSPKVIQAIHDNVDKIGRLSRRAATHPVRHGLGDIRCGHQQHCVGEW